MKKIITKICGVTFCALMLAACGASQAVMSHSKLDVQTQMSNSIFLEPVDPNQQVVYIKVTNTSDQPTLSTLQQALKTDMEDNGYTVTKYPSKAHYILAVNILRAGKEEPGAMQNVVGGGLVGGGVGAATGALATGGDAEAAGIGALAGATAGVLADTLVHNTSYIIVSNIQISERTSQNVNQKTKSVAEQGTSQESTYTSEQNTHWQVYRTKMVSSAQKVDLSFEDASPQLVSAMAESISGIF